MSDEPGLKLPGKLGALRNSSIFLPITKFSVVKHPEGDPDGLWMLHNTPYLS